MTDKDREQSLSETDKPWEKPGQTSQDESVQPPKNPVEQEKQKKDANWKKGE